MRVKYMTIRWPLGGLSKSSGYAAAVPAVHAWCRRFRLGVSARPRQHSIRTGGSFGGRADEAAPASDTAKGLDTCRAKLCCSSPARERIYPER